MKRLSAAIPFVLLLASTISCIISYGNAKARLADDLNSAIAAFASENAESLTSADTIASLRQMSASAEHPVIRKAAGMPHLCDALAGGAFYSLALVERGGYQAKAVDATIRCDSILLMSESAPEGFAVQLQGYALCTMAEVFSVSDQTLPIILLMLSVAAFFVRMPRRSDPAMAVVETKAPAIGDIKLTPMQRKLITMLMDAPDRRVGKYDICSALWGDKSNAEESLYTLVRRTKSALADTHMEIVCNRGESYELHVKG